MTTSSTKSPIGLPPGPITRDVLDTMPDDGHRYELIDGTLLVSPAPRIVHQRAVHRLAVLLDAAVPDGWDVLSAPTDVVLGDDSVVQPDVLVAPRERFTDNELPGAPVLAVEVLSPSTRGVDLLLKKDRLERAGCAHYWVIDPDTPSIAAWVLEDDRYVQAGSATGDEVLDVTEPVECSITPARLIA